MVPTWRCVWLSHGTDVAHSGELGLPHDVPGRADALHALDGLLQRHHELYISDGVLDGLYFGFHYYESMQAQREAALRSSALAQEAQLKMLRYQLNPHFLFNTLNAISTLILDNRNTVANSR